MIIASALSIFHAPFPDLLAKEMRSSMRGSGLFALVAGVTLCFGLYVALVWPNPDVPVWFRLISVRSAFLTFICLLLVPATLVLPILGASVVYEERRAQTLDQLLMSGATSAQIVLAKFIRAWSFHLFLVIGLLPLFSMWLLDAGLDAFEVVSGVVIVTATAAASAMVGVDNAASDPKISSAGRSVAFVYLYIVCFLFVPDALPRFVHQLLVPLSPGTMLYWLWAGRLEWYHTAGFVGTAALFCFTLFSRAVRLIRRGASFRTKPPIKLIHDEAKLRERRNRFPYYLIDPRKPKQPIGDRTNLMLQYEIRWGALRGGAIPALCFMAAFTILLGLMQYDNRRHADAWLMPFGVVNTLLLFATPVAVAALIARDTERNMMESLFSTPVTPRTYIMGKILALSCLLALVVVPMLSSALIVAPWTRMPLSMWVVGVTTMLTNAFCLTSLGCAVAVRIPGLVRAPGAALTAAVLLYLLPLIPNIASFFYFDSSMFTMSASAQEDLRFVDFVEFARPYLAVLQSPSHVLSIFFASEPIERLVQSPLNYSVCVLNTFFYTVGSAIALRYVLRNLGAMPKA